MYEIKLEKKNRNLLTIIFGYILDPLIGGHLQVEKAEYNSYQNSKTRFFINEEENILEEWTNTKYNKHELIWNNKKKNKIVLKGTVYKFSKVPKK